mmetsp:Transcript_117188/g.233507  ORF Transcript_117188/g.233507 Transcript_117188/m.233507 type:complete len:88 (-) Transcript_117188:568-831(-)
MSMHKRALRTLPPKLFLAAAQAALSRLPPAAEASASHATARASIACSIHSSCSCRTRSSSSCYGSSYYSSSDSMQLAMAEFLACMKS